MHVLQNNLSIETAIVTAYYVKNHIINIGSPRIPSASVTIWNYDSAEKINLGPNV